MLLKWILHRLPSAESEDLNLVLLFIISKASIEQSESPKAFDDRFKDLENLHFDKKHCFMFIEQ